MTTAEHSGMLLVGHGTRHEAGRREFRELTERLRPRMGGVLVEPAFLELAQPDIASAVNRLLEQGVESLVVSPLLLFEAGHAKRDIPRAVQQALAGRRLRDLAFSEPLGGHPRILALLERRYHEAWPGDAVGPPPSTRVILIGRGSRDAEATEQFHELAQQLSARLGVPVDGGFLAMARPPLDEVVQRIGAGAAGPVVLLPHLLFPGELLDRLQARAEEWKRQFAPQVWITAAHLGPVPEIVEVMIDRFQEARRRSPAARGEN